MDTLDRDIMSEVSMRTSEDLSESDIDILRRRTLSLHCFTDVHEICDEKPNNKRTKTFGVCLCECHLIEQADKFAGRRRK